MRRWVLICILLPAYFLSGMQKLNAQTSTQSDSAFLQNAISHLTAFYHKSVGNESNLFNGSERELYSFPFREGDPFFKEGSFKRGTVYYNHVIYSDVPLMYDIVRDELILLHFDSTHHIILVKEKVDWFEVHGHLFIKLDTSLENGQIRPGFYDELYKGKITLLMKRTKSAEENIEDRAVFLRTFSRSFFYVKMNGKIESVKSKKSLLSLLHDKKDELNQHIRRNKINFRKQPEEAMISVVAYYDQLIKK